MTKADARRRAFAALDSLIDALDSLTDEDAPDESDAETRREVEAHERRHEAELLAAAKAISERNKP